MTVADITALFSGVFGGSTKTENINPEAKKTENEDPYDYELEVTAGHQEEKGTSPIIWIAVVTVLAFIGVIGYEVYRKSQKK